MILEIDTAALNQMSHHPLMCEVPLRAQGSSWGSASENTQTLLVIDDILATNELEN